MFENQTKTSLGEMTQILPQKMFLVTMGVDTVNHHRISHLGIVTPTTQKQPMRITVSTSPTAEHSLTGAPIAVATRL